MRRANIRRQTKETTIELELDLEGTADAGSIAVPTGFFGHMLEALARAVVDLSGRGYFVWSAPPELEQVWVTREFPLTLVADFFQAFADRARLTLHLTVVAGRNPHHVAEACFKAVAVALRQAIVQREGGEANAPVPSTKGTLVG